MLVDGTDTSQNTGVVGNGWHNLPRRGLKVVLCPKDVVRCQGAWNGNLKSWVYSKLAVESQGVKRKMNGMAFGTWL